MRTIPAVLALLATGALIPFLPTFSTATEDAPATPRLRVAYVTPAATPSTEPDPAVLFADQFDRSPQQRGDYFEYGDENGSFAWNPNEGLGGGGAMKCQFEKGQVSAGSLKVVFGANPFGKGPRQRENFREIYWRVYVKHEPGWEGNPAKLARATCMAASDWSQGMIAHVWGGQGSVLCIDPATGITNSQRVTHRYNDFAHLRWLGLRNGPTPIFSPAESGRWVCVESHIRLNTPGKQDGLFELWVDGKPEASRTDLDWHGEWTDYAINAVFLENYWNEGSVKRQARWFDDFAISTRPIGPFTAAVTPTLTRTTADNVAAWEVEAGAPPAGNGEPNPVWRSRPVDGAATNLKMTAETGEFLDALKASKRLAPNTTYWLRLRERNATGAWSGWTAWHAPFRSAP